MVAPPDGAVAVSIPPTLADLAGRPRRTDRLVPEMPSRCRPAGGLGACPLRPDDTVSGGEGQVPLFGVRLQAGRCPAELVAALARPDHPPHQPPRPKI
jgi:hypothetical protein